MKGLSQMQVVDPTIMPLIEALTSFPGVTIVSSHVGCAQPAADESQLDNYSVRFEVEHSEAGWHTLAFLSWVFNVWLHNESLCLLPTAPNVSRNLRPLLVYFELQGTNAFDPDMAAGLLNQAQLENFDPVEVYDETEDELGLFDMAV